MKKIFVILILLITVGSISVTANIEIIKEPTTKIHSDLNISLQKKMENKKSIDLTNYESKWIEYNPEVNNKNDNIFYSNSNHYLDQDQTTILDMQSTDLTSLIIQITESTVTSYIQALVNYGPRVTGTSACDNAGSYISGVFSSLGLDVRIQEWSYGSYSGDNIEATLEGVNESSDQIYLVCAHYDSVSGSPGADDNAAGTAAVLASAKVMSQYTFSHTIKFVAFSGEEQGLYGSSIYAAEAASEGVNIIEVLNADMIGYTETDEGKHNIGVYGSATIATTSQQICDTYLDIIDLSVNSYGASANSDHWPFLQQGYDAAMYHEHEFNAYYHSPQDTMDKMDLDYDMRVTRLIMATLAEFSEIQISDDNGGGGHIIRPIVNIEYPVYGDNVKDIIKITGKASDFTSYIRYVLVQIDDSDWLYTEINETKSSYVEWYYMWDTTEFGDGNHTIKAASINKHGADSPIYFVKVKVINKELIVDIQGPDQAQINEEVSFQASISGGLPPYNISWDFGDGTISHEPAPSKEYNNPGIYNIKLTVIDHFNNIAYDEAIISIIDEIPPDIEIIKPENAIYLKNIKIFSFFTPVIIGKIDITLYAFDNNQIDYVVIYINGIEKDKLTNQPYSWTWDETVFGKISINAVAFDKSGNQAEDSIIVWKFF